MVPLWMLNLPCMNPEYGCFDMIKHMELVIIMSNFIWHCSQKTLTELSQTRLYKLIRFHFLNADTYVYLAKKKT